MFCAVLKELHEFGSLYFIKDNSIVYKGQRNVSYSFNLLITDIFLGFPEWHLYTGLTVYSEQKQSQQHIKLYIKDGGLG
jgi:hypothetical protein